ncbi:MAG: hypothetical protein COS10_05505 [Nitrospirae bacterium CG01_land_8_20_14_3_00_44_22]|nr:MAG: hypothetical protein COS10_05505 [Nitrospirae bacterium CG01_land_8_20_14_3_00_44_22]
MNMKRLAIVFAVLFIFSVSAYAQMGEGMKPEQKGQMGQGMMGGMPAQAKMKCAEEWLKKAIDLHEVHLKDPKTATEASQMEMMEQMKKAYECVIGGGKTEAAPSKETEGKEPPKTVPHQHKH